ncbi:MAG: hypothetical protein PHW76_09660 [Alphaproteobacteria bacterium]|nr:hypothetical protein [Alphaproteobacteria bacterium]
MTDYFISRTILEQLLKTENITNYLSIAQGRATIHATDDQPEQPAIGNTARYYTGIRTEQSEIILPRGTSGG